jgi:hypothetical protein
MGVRISGRFTFKITKNKRCVCVSEYVHGKKRKQNTFLKNKKTLWHHELDCQQDQKRYIKKKHNKTKYLSRHDQTRTIIF